MLEERCIEGRVLKLKGVAYFECLLQEICIKQEMRTLSGVSGQRGISRSKMVYFKHQAKEVAEKLGEYDRSLK